MAETAARFPYAGSLLYSLLPQNTAHPAEQHPGAPTPTFPMPHALGYQLVFDYYLMSTAEACTGLSTGPCVGLAIHLQILQLLSHSVLSLGLPFRHSFLSWGALLLQ